MRAMVFHAPGSPLRMEEREVPAPGAGEVLLRVHACGLCRTDLHLLDGELAVPSPPRILGHQIVGTVEALGAPVDRGDPGDPREPGKTGGRARGGAGGPAVGP
ncbi:MAG: alcohol dehydrogenase catalytic domain-containing protein, partial [Acidobacteriota bacterium]|nr:alcohol dehydrogenase catalytic domain-containing protein [Acidobacteriota bacterium]